MGRSASATNTGDTVIRVVTDPRTGNFVATFG